LSKYSIDKKNEIGFWGRTEGNKLVLITPSTKIKIGEFRDITITETEAWKLKGKAK